MIEDIFSALRFTLRWMSVVILVTFFFASLVIILPPVLFMPALLFIVVFVMRLIYLHTEREFNK